MSNTSKLHMEVLVETDPPSQIRILPDGLSRGLERFCQVSDLDPALPAMGIDFVVADARVLELHAAALGSLAKQTRFVVTPGEASKSIANLEALLCAFASAGLDRTSRVLAFGGGVTSDLAGLAAALFMRGIDWVSAPTTLLAQVDASIGGKTAINLAESKNLVGAFHQPSEVLIDTALLDTLEAKEWRSGLGEVLKAALLGAKTPTEELLFERLERATTAELTTKSGALISELVASCAAHKAWVVTQDFKESGVREQLNLGHTFAHAIEHVAGFGVVPHGVAVAVGLGLALELSLREGCLEDAQLVLRTKALAGRLGLPSSLGDLESELGMRLDRASIEAAMQLDKKVIDGTPRFVLVQSIGSVITGKRLLRKTNGSPFWGLAVR